MAQDVCSKMAEADPPSVLKEDGYLNADADVTKIVYHPSLNVILICGSSGVVHVLDVNSGVVLQSSTLSAQNPQQVTCRYIQGQDRVLFCDGQSIGVRSDYNGVLLLDTILQKPVTNTREVIKIELLLSEAIILKQSLLFVAVPDVDHVVDELRKKILQAQKPSRKGIKAQKWNTVCLEVPLDALRAATNSSVSELIVKNQHTPELGVTSAVYERLSELCGEQANASDRRAMASEAKRRETFTHWPHMDYKWALPDQMAQAGFYHQPNASGDDRAMCFTCTVCLVCWERTDEPWSEHERHSATCPFVMGEYTQNVPLSVTHATNPAADATYRGELVKVLGSSAVPHLLATANEEGLVAVFDISGKPKRTHTFFVTQFDSHILERLTADFGVPGTCSESEVKYPAEKDITALTIVDDRNHQKASTTNSNNVRPAIICGLKIRCRPSPKNPTQQTLVETLNDQNKNNQAINIMEVDDEFNTVDSSCLYLVVYDFQYMKEVHAPDKIKIDLLDYLNVDKRYGKLVFPEDLSPGATEAIADTLDDTNMDIASSNSDDMPYLLETIDFTKPMPLYQNLIPGESDEIFIPPPITASKPGFRKLYNPGTTETDSAAQGSLIIPPDYSFTNGQLGSSLLDFHNEKSISDHITEMKNSKKRKELNYSRAIQCVSLPEQYKNHKDLEISHILPTQDGGHILVVLRSVYDNKNSILLMYALNFTSKDTVILHEKPVMVREISASEKPSELTLLSQLDRVGEVMERGLKTTSCEGTVIMVCEDGAVRLLDLSTLKVVSIAKLDGVKFVSAVYCNSLERLCASTKSGSLHFYAINDTDNDSVEDQEDDDIFTITNEVPSSSNIQSEPTDLSSVHYYFHEPHNVINLPDLKRLQSLCMFEPLKAGYCSVVPPCWSEMQQAQRQRRHPHLQVDSEQHTKTFRLQTDTTTWDEHVFEITLPTPTCIGHVDVHFSLHPSLTPPHVEITLLKQNSSGIGHRRDIKFAVDETVTFDTFELAENPVTSPEFLQAHNVDILAGPIDLVSCIDLTEQGGCATLTSPQLFKTRIRTLLIHVKAVYSKESGKPKFPFKNKRNERVDKLSQGGSSRKAEYYMGCDCLHEVSITVNSVKHTDVPHERQLRCCMLESGVFVDSLFETVRAEVPMEQKCIALDILVWVAAIRLSKNRSFNGQIPVQQVDFLKTVEGKLELLTKNCLLLANRSMAHKCIKLIIICCNGAKHISENVSKTFEENVLENLMMILNNIDQVQSSASLLWLSTLLIKVTQQKQSSMVVLKCISLLYRLSDELHSRINPYHLILRSRYGLYGTPLEPELFDVDPPSLLKSSSTAMTYASVVAGENTSFHTDFHTNFAFNKETLDPKEVLGVCKGDSKIKLKNMLSTKLVRGLLETEPLHFVCILASEGTRLERADSAGGNGGGYVNNIVPIAITSSPQTQSSGTKKVEVDQFPSEVAELGFPAGFMKNNGNGQGGSNPLSYSLMDGAYQVVFQTDNVKTDDFSKLISDTLEISVDSDSSSMNSETQNKAQFTADQILFPNQSLPWQQLLLSPPQQVIVVDRMHSGARRFVTLDFGQPILLTDVVIPACQDLVSLGIDVWVKGEDVDAIRLVVASDIGSKNLVLNDLQPPPLCRYMKITMVGRYGMSTTRCRIPVGCIYGHMMVVGDDASSEQVPSATSVSPTDLENQLNVLSMLLEDVNCRYSLACSKLKDLLHPFLTSDITNAAHLAAYMGVMKDSSSGTVSQENSKIFAAYREAVTYQRQLNTVRNVMHRIENILNATEQPSNTICNDKLRCIVESLLETVLVMDSSVEISLEWCRNLFQGLCVTQSSRVQVLAATLLVRLCGRQPYWGQFLAETLKEMFSSSYTLKFPQDRVFVLIAFLGRRSPERSSVLEATLRVIAEVLLPLAQNRHSLLAVAIDLPLLGWLLLFLSLQLDTSKSAYPSSNRWDWVTGEMAEKVNEAVGSANKKRLHKGVLQFKQQMEKVVQSSTQVQALSALSTHAANLTSKLQAAIKQQQFLFHKVKHLKASKESCSPYRDGIEHSKQAKRRREPQDPSQRAATPPTLQNLDTRHCLAVAKALLALLLAVDHSCSADMFLLSCKVVSRLVSIAKLQLGQLLTEEQLLKLVHICIGSELPWAPHALACLLQDVVEVGKPPSNDTEMDTDSMSATTSWSNLEFLRDVDSLCESYLEETGSEPVLKQGKTTSSSSSTSNNMQLPSVYESDDSELEDFLEDILERGRTTLKKTSKTVPAASSSCALDARLELGVEVAAETALRRMLASNSATLVQNLSATVPQIETQSEPPTYPSGLLQPWQVDAPVLTTNRSMLVSCFNVLFKELHMQSPLGIEHVLQLWLTLNSVNGEDRFDPSTIPFINLNQEAVSALVSAIAWSSGLSLRTWCSALQTLTLVCNMMQQGTNTSIQWSDPYGLYAMTMCILNHSDFVQLFLRLLSGSGLIFSEKGVAGPSLCKALQDFLLRLHTRCNVGNASSREGSQLKSLLLKIVYQLVQPSGPLSARQGPLDAQCKLLQSMLQLDYANADLSIAISIFESTAVLVHAYISQVDRIKCVNIGERLNNTSHLFSGIFASVLGNESNKQDKPVSWDVLLVALLKLLAKLVQTPLPNNSGDQTEAMETETAATSQTDESKVEQIQQERSGPPVPCFADTVLQHVPSVIKLCQSLASCKASSLSMLANISQQNSFADLGEPGTVGDAVFHILAALARKTSRKEFIMEPLLLFLSQVPQLSEPLLWFILQVLDTEDALRNFLDAGGIRILSQSLVQSSNAPNTVFHAGNVSMVMQHFGGAISRSDASTAIAAASSAKKLQQATLENTMALINFAPFGTIRCESTTAQTADVLINGGSASHRRARSPQWSYHFYPEEVHTELTLQLPSAILLREVHLQPHLSSLATCPSAVALEVSADGPSRLVPACPPLPTSGMTFIRLHLPVPEVVNCVQLRLYKPRDANNIGLSQIRLLGTSAFGGSIKQQVLDLTEDESHCKYSLGWLRLLHHCFTLPSDPDLRKEVVANAALTSDLLPVCCGLLLVPTHIPALYLPNLEKVLCELSLYDCHSGLDVIRRLLENRPSVSEPFGALNSTSKGSLLLNSIGNQSACELLYQICSYQDGNTAYRLSVLVQWLKTTTDQALSTRNLSILSPAYMFNIASIIWAAHEAGTPIDLASITHQFTTIYRLTTLVKDNVALKHSLDALLCSLCFIRIDLFPMLLQLMGILVPNLSTNHEASISDDQKDSESMTDDLKRDSEWYGRLMINDLKELKLSEDQLETIALVCRSPTAIQQFLDSGLPKLLNRAILEFCTNCQSTYPMARLENITAVLKFFADICDEKIMRDWLGSKYGSCFWLPLLQFLCKRPSRNRAFVKSEAHAQLEETCVRFLNKCCLCHSHNQTLLAKVLCEVISQQRNGISGFMRRLILQLLLENERVPVSIRAEETIYKNSTWPHAYFPNHPALKQTHSQVLLYLNTSTILADILEQHITFTTTIEMDSPGMGKKDGGAKNECIKGWWCLAMESDLSMAAGVTAKDKRAKDAKNQATATPQLKKKRYASVENSSTGDVIDGKAIHCDAVSDQPLPIALTLGQLLRIMETKGTKPDWPCIYLKIVPSKGSEDKNKGDMNAYLQQTPFNSALQVFSSVGGLALLAQHLPAIYPEIVRAPATEKTSSEPSESDWVKVEDCVEVYEDIEDPPRSSTPNKSPGGVLPNVPTHSLTAFGLFLRLPGYAEVLLKDMKKACCLLRLVLGVTDDGEGGDIFQSPIADSLPTLPFEVLRKLYDSTPLSTDDGRVLRKLSINTGVVHLLLACLGIFTHQTQAGSEKEGQKDKDSKTKDERTQLYWAKGTGFGTGSTQQSWNVEQALLKQRSEEEHVTVLLQVLASYINPKGEAADELADNVLPPAFYQLLANSALLPALSSYLRNDSVLDMARHIPLYRAALQLLRALAASSQLVSLLMPQKERTNGPSVSALLKNMKTCVDTYASKLRSAESLKTAKKFGSKQPANGKYKFKISDQLEELERDEGLAQLMPDIQATANMVKAVTDRLEDSDQEGSREGGMDYPLATSVEERYLTFMRRLQFDTFEMIQELPEGGGYRFAVSHHFESNARTAGEQSHPARVKRLAQEAATLATSLPLSYSSSVFVRCDTDRLDIMKVLITGPADTPYANGCFELDVYFPPDYPLAPMMINLETTGHHSVRFNPNLYNDGKVCLSVLNTWHGRPEEKWNAQTSSFLQVLVSIQSLILVSEPYFNEPGYERSRGTPAGTQSSREYNQNICQATVRWAMLEQIVKPCPCFKDVIHAHFYLKRNEIMAQVEEWIKDMENHFTEKRVQLSTNKRSTFANVESFKKVYEQLKEKLMQLTPPAGLEETEKVQSDEKDSDVGPEKMVEEMC